MKPISYVLGEKEIDFTWNYLFHVVGANAFTHFADLWNASHFVKKAKVECDLNGYLYGVGCDSILALLELFPAHTMPKGIILTDIDPSVVTCAKILKLCFARAATVDEFYKMCIQTPFEGHFSDVFVEETNSIFQDYMCEHKERTKNSWEYSFTAKPHPERAPYWVREGYLALHKLAREGNFVVLHADLFDKRLLDCIRKLPGWTTSNNLVYMANASDHIHRHVMRNCTKELFVEKLNEQIVSNFEALKC